jgi:predicted nucleic acid-binding protein
VKIVFNSSPLIFMVRLGFLNSFLDSVDEFYIPAVVAEEICAKSDEPCHSVQELIDYGKITARATKLNSLAKSLNMRLGKGESEAIALGIELPCDYIILDDRAARKEATRLGLNVKGTLAVIKKLQADGQISIANLDQLYQELVAINFRVKRVLFDAIFKDG